MARGLKKFFGNMHQRFRKEERPPRTVPFFKNLEEEPDESLGQGPVFGVGFPGIFPAGTDGRHGLEMPGHLPVEVDVGEDGLPAPGHGLLGEFKDQHLGQLLDLPVRQAFQVGGEKEVDGIPADGPGEMALQGRGELDHVGQQHLGVFGRFGHGQGLGQVQTEFLDVLQGLAGTVGAVHKPQVMEMNIAAHVGIAHLRRKHREQSVFLLDPLRQGQVGGLGTVGDIGVFLVGVNDQLVHVVPGHAQAGMAAPRFFQPPLDQLGVDQFPDQRGRDHLDPGGADHLLHLAADGLRRAFVHQRLPHQGLHDAPAVPGNQVFIGGADKQSQIRGFGGIGRLTGEFNDSAHSVSSLGLDKNKSDR